jgi:hypothetical protein
VRIAIGLRHHHRDRAQVGHDHADDRHDRLPREHPADDATAGDRDHREVERCQAALPTPDRQEEDEAGEERLAGGEQQAPRGPVCALGDGGDDRENAPDQPCAAVRPRAPAHRVAHVRDRVDDADQPSEDSQDRCDAGHAATVPGRGF